GWKVPQRAGPFSSTESMKHRPADLRPSCQCGKRGQCGLSLCVYSLFVLSFSLVATSESSAQQKPPAITEPKLLSVFPSAGRQGTTVQAEIRGNLIQGSYAVWFDGATLAGRVLKVEEASEQPAESANGH